MHKMKILFWLFEYRLNACLATRIKILNYKLCTSDRENRCANTGLLIPPFKKNHIKMAVDTSCLAEELKILCLRAVDQTISVTTKMVGSSLNCSPETQEGRSKPDLCGEEIPKFGSSK